MRLSDLDKRNVLEVLDRAISTLKDARAHAYHDGRLRLEKWDSGLVQLTTGLAINDLADVVKYLGHPGEAARLQQEGWALFEEGAHFTPNRGVEDKDAAQELYLYLTNTSELFGPRSMGEAIERRYAKLWKKGQFDEAKAAKGYDYLVAEAAKRYQKEIGDARVRWHDTFNAPTRRLVSEQLVDDFTSEAKLGNFRL